MLLTITFRIFCLPDFYTKKEKLKFQLCYWNETWSLTVTEKKHIENVCKQGAEENIWIQQKRSKRSLEKIS